MDGHSPVGVAGEPAPMVFIVEDDDDVRETIATLAQSVDLTPVCCTNCQEFLQRFDDSAVCCVVADIRLPRMSGLELLKECRTREIESPIILVTGFADVDVAVAAMKDGAFDFLQKPFSAHRLIEALLVACRASAERLALKRQRTSAAQALKALTEREVDVAHLMVEGLRTKDIARRLGLSHRTVEKHRRNIHCKTGAQSVAALVALFAAAHEGGPSLQPAG